MNKMDEATRKSLRRLFIVASLLLALAGSATEDAVISSARIGEGIDLDCILTEHYSSAYWYTITSSSPVYIAYASDSRCGLLSRFQPGGRFSTTCNSHSPFRLSIAEVTLSDTGSYECTVDGITERIYDVHVYGCDCSVGSAQGAGYRQIHCYVHSNDAWLDTSVTVHVQVGTESFQASGNIYTDNGRKLYSPYVTFQIHQSDLNTERYAGFYHPTQRFYVYCRVPALPPSSLTSSTASSTISDISVTSTAAVSFPVSSYSSDDVATGAYPLTEESLSRKFPIILSAAALGSLALLVITASYVIIKRRRPSSLSTKIQRRESANEVRASSAYYNNITFVTASSEHLSQDNRDLQEDDYRQASPHPTGLLDGWSAEEEVVDNELYISSGEFERDPSHNEAKASEKSQNGRDSSLVLDRHSTGFPTDSCYQSSCREDSTGMSNTALNMYENLQVKNSGSIRGVNEAPVYGVVDEPGTAKNSLHEDMELTKSSRLRDASHSSQDISQLYKQVDMSQKGK